MKTHGPIRCPACQGTLVPVKLHCPACDISVSGRFAVNEFAGLAEDDLHFLRIFVLCEGRIRDMESALGVSYPTIKGRMTHLKATLAAARPEPPQATEPAEADLPAVAVLQELEAGRISYEQALERLKAPPKES